MEPSQFELSYGYQSIEAYFDGRNLRRIATFDRRSGHQEQYRDTIAFNPTRPRTFVHLSATTIFTGAINQSIQGVHCKETVGAFSTRRYIEECQDV